MSGAGETIEIKKRKLASEISKNYPNQHKVKRLKESISRHRKEMKTRSRNKKRIGRNRKIGRMR